jgi:hypothetical protein
VLDEDVAPLSEPFTPEELHAGTKRSLLVRWGWVFEDLWTLERELRENLDCRRYGFAAWLEQPLDDQRRILISDHLLDAVNDVSTNLVEAKIHLSSFRALSNEAATRVKWRPDLGGGFQPRLSESPHEALKSAERSAHLTGLLRALGSTLDCLGTAVVGLAALPVNLKRSDWAQARKALRKAGGPTQELLDLDALVESAGPPGWSDWTLQMRNRYVHRPRPMQLSYLRPIYQPSAGPRIVGYLPSTPSDSWVESFARAGSAPSSILPEDATTTMAHVTTSVVAVTSTLSARLLALWRARLECDWLVQPEVQWRKPSAPPSFEGYVKDERMPRGRGMSMMLNPIGTLRMEAAALLEKQRRKVWRDWPRSFD